MKRKAKRTIHVIGLLAVALAFAGTAEKSRAQSVRVPADSTETDASGATNLSPSAPLPRAEALAAIAENNHLILLPWYNLGTAPQGAWVAGYMKLVTPIAQNENNMFSIKIKGYRYGTGGTPVEIRCGGYAYSGTNSLISSDCYTEGTADRVGIGTENGSVIVTIGSNESGQGVWYYDHLTAEYSGDSGKNANDFNWQFVYNATPTTTNTHNVVIKDSAGTITTSGSVGIGTSNPSRRFTVSNGGAEGFEVGPGNANGDASGNVTMVSYNRSASAYLNNQWFASSFLFGTSAVNGGISISNSNPTTGQSAPLFMAVSNATGNISTTSIESVSNAGSTAADFMLRTGATSATGFGVARLVVNGATGNTGVGITSPQQKLHVGGNVFAEGIITSNSEPSYGAGSQLRSWGLNKDDANMYIEFGNAAGNILYLTDHWRYTSPIALMAGNVGIGTASPSQKLQIGDNSTAALGLRIAATGVNWDQTTDANGNLNIGNGNGSYLTFTKSSITSSFAGNVTVSGSINAKYQDVAEWVPSSEQLSAGTVVVLDSTKSNQVTSSTVSYDTRVAGVVSEQPGIALGEKSDNKVLVATTGRVRIKVDTSKGPIHIGDLLVTSDVPGMAMKSEPIMIGGRQIHAPGTLIGKALEPLEKGSGFILVLLSLQ